MSRISRRPYGTKTGLAKISAGATQWGIPGNPILAQGTSAMAANEVRYIPMIVPYRVVLTAWELEVTTGPTGAANIAVGLYLADSTMQPAGAPLYDSGSVPVANAFTGIKTATSLSIALTPGVYLVAANCDNALTVRTIISPAPFAAAALGATPIIQRVYQSQTYGAFPTPGTAWTNINASAGGSQNVTVWQWAE